MQIENKSVVERIEKYLRRLGTDEKFEAVRADFVKEFKEVDAADIMQAEQQLLQNGTPLEEVQRLCDVHAALFTEKQGKNRLPMLRRNRSRQSNKGVRILWRHIQR